MDENVYDQITRKLPQSDPIGFVRWLAEGIKPELGFQTWLDTRSVVGLGNRDRTGDLYAELATEDRDFERFVLAMEFMSKARASGLFRSLLYACDLLHALVNGPFGQDRSYWVVPALVNLSGEVVDEVIEMKLPGCEKGWISFRVIVQNVRWLSALETLARIERGEVSDCVVPLLALMDGGGAPEFVGRCRARLMLVEDPYLREERGAAAMLLSELTPYAAQWRAGLEGLNVVKSPLVEEWTAEARNEGLNRGQALGQQKALIELLRLRFLLDVTSEDEARVKSEKDLATLSEWFRVAVLAPTVQVYREKTAP